MTAERSSLSGQWAALLAFLLWGFLPVYWKALAAVPPVLVVGHRVVWSLLVLLLALLFSRRLGCLRQAMNSGRLLAWHTCSGVLLAINWFLYIYATLTDRVIEASLGYFLNPLLSVAFGWFLLREKSNRWQMIAVGLATFGVGLQAVAITGLPWIALSLAVSFSLYGLARKKSQLGSLEGLAVETLLMTPFALVALWFMPGIPLALRPTADISLLIGSGIATTIPLLLFAFAARKIRLATLGILQFMVPSLQFILGHWLYHEPLGPARLVSFCFIWTGVAVFIVASSLTPGGVIEETKA